MESCRQRGFPRLLVQLLQAERCLCRNCRGGRNALPSPLSCIVPPSPPQNAGATQRSFSLPPYSEGGKGLLPGRRESRGGLLIRGGGWRNVTLSKHFYGIKGRGETSSRGSSALLYTTYIPRYRARLILLLEEEAAAASSKRVQKWRGRRAIFIMKNLLAAFLMPVCLLSSLPLPLLPSSRAAAFFSQI